MGMTTGSFCTGICAPEAAWRSLGWEPQFFSEIDPFACAVERHHFPHVPNLGNMHHLWLAFVYGARTIRRRIRKGKPWETLRDWLKSLVRMIERARLWVAGTPCQAFSMAGKRGSLADDRGNLSLIFCELIHGFDPEIVVWENVPGVLSVKDNAFGADAGMGVRRLTPLECERLQGFPDGWTDIMYRRKPAEDGPRYRAIGNSMAVPVPRWLGARIEAVNAAKGARG